MQNKAKRRRAEYFSTMDVYPLAIVLLMVLINFMAITPMLCSCAYLALPKFQYARELPGAMRDDALVAAITADNKIYMDTRQVTPEELSVGLRDRSIETEKRSYLSVDRRAQYGAVKFVLNTASEAGIQQISFVASDQYSH